MLGLLSLRHDQEIEYFTEIAKRAKPYNLHVVRFTPFQIDPITEQVQGLLFDADKQQWKRHTFAIPPFIYDRCFYSGTELSKKGKPIVEWLKKRPDTLLLGYGLPDKLTTYEVLLKNAAASHYVPHTEAATVERVWKYLWRHKEAVLKPINGSQGNGFCYLSYRRQGLQAVIQEAKQTKTESFLSKEDFMAWLTPLLQGQPYMLQPFLTVQDAYGQPFDIRILLQKNEQGVWEETGRGVRCGTKQSIVSNLHAGSRTILYEEWKRSYPAHEQILLEDNISTLLRAVPLALEAALPPLFEIGLDISVDRDGAVWLLDVNSKPGRKVILQCCPENIERLYNAPLAYYKHLALQVQKGGDSR